MENNWLQPNSGPAPNGERVTEEKQPASTGIFSGTFQNIKSTAAGWSAAAQGHAENLVARGKQLAAILPSFKRPSSKLSAAKQTELKEKLNAALSDNIPSLQEANPPNPSPVLVGCCRIWESVNAKNLGEQLVGVGSLIQHLLQSQQVRVAFLTALQEKTEAVLNEFQVSSHAWGDTSILELLSQEDAVKAYCLLRMLLERIAAVAKRSPGLLQSNSTRDGSLLQEFQKAESGISQVEESILAPVDGFWKTRVGFVYQEYTSLQLPMRKVAAVVKASPDNLLDRITRLHSLGRQALVDQAVVEEKSSSLADDLLSLGCVMAHCFLATFNYYGYYAAFASIPQTNPNLVAYLSSAGYFQLIFAIGPVVDLAMQKYYEFLSKRNYATIYAHSVLFLVVGNLCYFFQKDLTGSNAMVLLMVSRAFMGAGLSKKASEKYLAVMINSKFQGLVNMLCSLITRVGQMLGPSIAVWFVFNTNGKDVDYYPILMTISVGILGIAMIFLFKPQDEKIAMRQQRNEAEAQNNAEDNLEDARDGDFSKIPYLSGFLGKNTQEQQKDLPNQQQNPRRIMNEHADSLGGAFEMSQLNALGLESGRGAHTAPTAFKGVMNEAETSNQGDNRTQGGFGARDVEVAISQGLEKGDPQAFEQQVEEAIEKFKKEAEIYLRWSTWYLFATSVCSKLAMEMFFTEKSMISNSWTAVGYTLSVSGFIYLILSFINGSATFTFNQFMKCCPPRFFLPLGLLTLLVGSIIKFPYDTSKTLGLVLYYIGTAGIILGSALTDACVFRLFVSTKSAAGVGLVAATGFSELASGIAKIVANSASGIIGVLQPAGKDKVPLYFYSFCIAAFTSLFIAFCLVKSKLANIDPEKDKEKGKEGEKAKEGDKDPKNKFEHKEKSESKYSPISLGLQFLGPIPERQQHDTRVVQGSLDLGQLAPPTPAGGFFDSSSWFGGNKA